MECAAQPIQRATLSSGETLSHIVQSYSSAWEWSAIREAFNERWGFDPADVDLRTPQSAGLVLAITEMVDGQPPSASSNMQIGVAEVVAIGATLNELSKKLGGLSLLEMRESLIRELAACEPAQLEFQKLWDSADRQLCQWMGEGSIIGKGQPADFSSRTFLNQPRGEIPAEIAGARSTRFRFVTITDWWLLTHDVDVFNDPHGEFYLPQRAWGDIEFAKSDVDRLVSTLICRRDSCVAIASATSAGQKPRPTNPAVRGWIHDRVAAWADDKPAPSEEDDFAALSEHFAPGLSRDDFRELRKKETPALWRKQGKRLPWGQVKSR
jgi:hypothetical protein